MMDFWVFLYVAIDLLLVHSQNYNLWRKQKLFSNRSTKYYRNWMTFEISLEKVNKKCYPSKPQVFHLGRSQPLWPIICSTFQVVSITGEYVKPRYREQIS